MLKGTKVKQKLQKTMKISKTALKKFNSAPVRQKIGVGFIVAVMAFGFAVSPFAFADRYSSKIAELQAENSHSHEKVDALRIRAENIQDAVNKLQAKINELQVKIQTNKVKSDKLKQEIKVAEAELENQRRILGENIKAMYLEGDISTLEILATSKDLSDFVDKEQYREVVKDKIKGQVDKITALRLELKSQREKIEALIKEDEEIRSSIGAQKSEKNRLLAMNEAEQANFNKQIAKNNKKIDELLNAQAALSRKLAGGVFVSLGPVRQGDIVGTVGNTGYSDGAHLHLEARSSGGGVFNPRSKLGSGWIYPVQPVSISQEFGYTPWSYLYRDGRHPGMDFLGAGNVVKAVADGQIISRGCSQDSSFFGTNAYGYAVVIQHNDGTFSVYAHMVPPSSGYEHCNFSTF